MSGARVVRRRVDDAGGRLVLSVRDLRDTFGVARLTAAGRVRIERELAEAGLRVEPSLKRCALHDPVAIVDVHQPAAASGSAVRPAGPVAGPAAAARSGGSRRRVAAVGSAVAVGLVALTVALGSGGGGGEAATPPPPESQPVITVAVADGAEDARARAMEEVAEARALIAADKPSAAIARLEGIDSGFAADHPDLARRVREARRLAGLTRRYLDAERLAEGGSFAAARGRMLALAPFRDARARARTFGSRGARELVAQARAVYASRPDRALGLLRNAAKLDPGLPAIASVRSLATQRKAALAAPPAPTSAPSSSSAACDPNYAGACIPRVSYDLDCGDVSATGFRSVDSDPHGFDRDGDGWACEP
ncbi:MAG: hypothetical protein AB7V42_01420 [Thermoleophilia bacterium]